MDQDTKQAFEKVFDNVVSLREEIGDLRSDIKRMDIKIDAIPDKIDTIYARTINNILDRLQAVEQKLGISVRS
jgi:phage host-nuclease inhibitor protein Gam